MTSGRGGRSPAAVLWDYDGSLVDSESLWHDIERQLARELGGELAHDYQQHTIGGSIAHTASFIVTAVGSDADPAVVVDELWARAERALAEGPIRWMPGAERLLTALAEAGVPMALVSSGHRHYLDVVLRRLDPSPFAVVVAGDEVAHPKPHPDPYLRACAALDLDPALCLAIEDSYAGAASANAAGCAVLAVPTLRHALPDAPRRVIRETLLGLDVAALAGLYRDVTSGVVGRA